MPKKETKQFQAEVKQILSIVINSLYTHKEIFLRELVANASDALDKLRVLALTDSAVLEKDTELRISIEIDKDQKTLTISDNGMGMTYNEVVEHIGTIAKSGSEKFLELLKKRSTKEEELDLIGQFGVGFYSAFMAADKVVLLTRAPQEEMGVRWESMGDGSYTIEQSEKEKRGTDVILYLKKIEGDHEDEHAEEDFLNPYTIQKLVGKYCNFINYPIRMNFYTEEPEQDKEGKVVEGGKTTTTVEEKTLNDIKPIWQKDKKEIKKDEYVEFYKHHFHDWNAPAEIVHFKGEGTTEFTALLFIPSVAPYDLYSKEAHSGVQLYSKNVLIMQESKDLLPEYLKFVRGIVDSSDLSLNISREMLQHDRQLRIIGNRLEKKILETLRKLLSENREKYTKLWKEYGKAIKGGLYLEYKNKEKLQDFLLFESSHSESEMTTLQEYVHRMQKGQKDIFYAVGETRDFIERMPQMEVVKEKGIEVLYFVDKVDEFLTQNLHEYQGKNLQSVSRGDLTFDEGDKKDDETSKDKENDVEQKEEDQEKNSKPEEEYKPLTEFMKEALGDKIKEVRVSHRLTSSPVCLVSDSTGYSLNMERLMKEANQTLFRATKILEINPTHDLIKMIRVLLEKGSEENVKEYTDLLYNQALLIEGEQLEDPIGFSSRVDALMLRAHHNLGE